MIGKEKGFETAASKTQARVGWKVLVYLAGDNNLSDEMIWSLLGMQAAADDPGFRKNVKLTAVYDPARREPLEYKFPSNPPPPPGHFGLGAFGGQRSSLVGLSDLSTFHQLVHFIEKQFGDAPDQDASRMIVLSGHGNGVEGLLMEDRRGEALSIRQLGEALRRAANLRHHAGAGPNRIQILGLEACTLGMLELCHEVRDSVEYVVGTESFVQNNGWPYERMLAALPNSTDAGGVATNLARIYAQYYSEYDIGGVSTDIAVIKLEDIEEQLTRPLGLLARELCEILRNLKDEPPLSAADERNRAFSTKKDPTEVLLDAIGIAHWRAQSYSLDSFVDLEDWIVQLLHALRGTDGCFAGIVAQCEAVLQGLDAVVRASLYQGPAFQHSHGLSIYFPAARRRYNPSYRELAFARDTGWHTFLELYLEKAQRGLRRETGAQDLYTYEDDERPVVVGQPPASVRTPPNGTKRQTPPNGTRILDGIDGYTKNGPRAWYRDLRFAPAAAQSEEAKNLAVLTAS